MGIVYEGFDLDIERRVAIKILHPHLINDKNGEEFLERFKREAKSAAKCTHPNVVTVLEFGQDGDMPYIVMEFVEGLSLQQIIKKRRPISLQKTLLIMSQLLKALHYAHHLGIVHRDIKSANVMILKESGDVKLADFGIARIAKSPELTMTGAVVGTPKYMSPEQMFGLKVGSRADLFSVAMVFLELLTLLPKSSSIPRSSLPEIVNLPPNNRVDYSILYPTALIPVLQKGLAISQEKRYQTAREFVQAIKSVLPNLKSSSSSSSTDATSVVQQSTQIFTASQDELDSMTSLLVEYVGPIAKNIMVEHGNNSSASDLASAISREIPQPEERQAFLKRWEHMSGSRIDATRLGESGVHSTNSTTTGTGIKARSFDDEILKRISESYTSYVGPLAGRLVRHYSGTTNNLEKLLDSLSNEIPNAEDGQKFKDTWLRA